MCAHSLRCATTSLLWQAFNAAFQLAATELGLPIVRRECSSCTSTAHQDIYYKRPTAPETFEPYSYMVSDWISTSNTQHIDFELYSTFEDAVSGTNPWCCCTFDDAGIGFPRDCGPLSTIGGNWNSAGRGGQADVRFSVPGVC